MRTERNNLSEIEKTFEKAVVETILSDNGQITYVLMDDIDLAKYALMAKTLLEARKEIAHDFVGTVTNQSRTDQQTFTYNSGWFLDGIANGETE